MEMMRQAKAAGCDAVKLQKRDNRTLYPPEVYDRPYNSEHAFGDTYGKHREALEFGWEEYVDLKAYAESLGLIFFATAFDRKSVDFLDRLDVPAIKIASFDVRSLDLIKYAASTKRPLIISTGTASQSDLADAIVASGADVSPEGAHKVALLHAVSEYPAAPEHLNLSAITVMRRWILQSVIGYSGHDQSIFAPLIAYTLGARIIEKHFTLNRAMKGSDHAWSLEPSSMAKMVKELRRARLSMGDGVKRPIPEEMAALIKAGKEPNA